MSRAGRTKHGWRNQHQSRDRSWRLACSPDDRGAGHPQRHSSTTKQMKRATQMTLRGLSPKITSARWRTTFHIKYQYCGVYVWIAFDFLTLLRTVIEMAVMWGWRLNQMSHWAGAVETYMRHGMTLPQHSAAATVARYTHTQKHIYRTLIVEKDFLNLANYIVCGHHRKKHLRTGHSLGVRKDCFWK